MLRRSVLLFLTLCVISLSGCGSDNETAHYSDSGSGKLTWSFVDGKTYAGLGNGSTTPRLVQFGSKLYATWIEPVGPSLHVVRISVYNGNDAASSWSYVDGGTGIGGPSSSAPQLAVFNEKLYAVWSDGSPAQVRVAVYNGNDSAPAWTVVDGNAGLNEDAAKQGETPQLTVFDGKLYATWQERGASNAVQVAIYNGNDASPAWSFVDNGGIAYSSTGGNAFPQMIEYGSRLYIAFQNNGIDVYVYNGNDTSPSWSEVSDPKGSIYRATTTGYPKLAVFSNKLYLTWREELYTVSQNVWQVRVAVYNGNDAAPAWKYLESNDFYGINKDPMMQVDNEPQLLIHGSRMYAIWTERIPLIEIAHVRIAAYNGNDSAPAWEFMDNGKYGLNFDIFGNADSPHMTVFNNKIYATWRESTDTVTSARVAVGQ